jgi:tetraacyldisaccharide 4'-kinase
LGDHDPARKKRRDRPEDLLVRRGGAVELLRLPAMLMRGITGLRNALYDRGILPSRRLELPVVSAGNLTVGGTGKTPMVAWLARALLDRGRKPGVLSRGYRGTSGGLNDEGRLLDSILPDVPHVQRADRVAGGIELEGRGVDVILLDDGFQHRRLARDIDLVLVDATRPWGLPEPAPGEEPVRSLLPRGLLREDLDSLARASAIVVTRSDQVEAACLAALEVELEEHAPGIPLLLAAHRPRALRDGGESHPVEALRGRRVQLVSGIGNPNSFERIARSLGAEVAGVHAFPDHHDFTPLDLEDPIAGEGELLVTAKDAVKIEGLGVPHLVLEVELELTRGLPVMYALLDALPDSRRGVERRALHEGMYG